MALVTANGSLCRPSWKRGRLRNAAAQNITLPARGSWVYPSRRRSQNITLTGEGLQARKQRSEEREKSERGEGRGRGREREWKGRGR
eukprot:1842428-Pleurochrysis_carterae.AAC.1